MVMAGGWVGREWGVVGINGHTVLAQENEKVLEMDGDSYHTPKNG